MAVKVIEAAGGGYGRVLADPRTKAGLAVREVPVPEMVGVVPVSGGFEVGDVALVRVVKVGKNRRIEAREGFTLDLFEGDCFLGAFGNRYATGQFEGYVPEGVAVECDMLSNVTDDAGRPNPKTDRTFSVIERLFDHVRKRLANTSESYGIYGHSAGGQFVHRMAMLAPESRFHTAVAANTGWYTMPDEQTDFPYGLRGTDASLEAALSRRLVVLLGEADTDPEDPFLRTTEEATRQGATRLERGHAFCKAAREKAAMLGADLEWKLEVVPGATHLDRQMMPAAAREIFRQIVRSGG